MFDSLSFDIQLAITKNEVFYEADYARSSIKCQVQSDSFKIFSGVWTNANHLKNSMGDIS